MKLLLGLRNEKSRAENVGSEFSEQGSSFRNQLPGVMHSHFDPTLASRFEWGVIGVYIFSLVHKANSQMGQILVVDER